MTERQQSEIDRADVEQARKFLEVLHGDLVRSGYQSEDDMESLTGQAEGVKTALNVLEQVENGEWDSDLASEAMDQVGDGDDTDADELRDLSQHVRNDDFASDHVVVNRVTAEKEPRSYWALVKAFLGVGDRV